MQSIVDKNFVSETSEIQSFFKLVKIDEKLGTSFGQTISEQWNDLIKNENFLKLLLTKSDSNYAKATLIMFKFDGRGGWTGLCYEELKTDYDLGYTACYLIFYEKSPFNSFYSKSGIFCKSTGE